MNDKMNNTQWDSSLFTGVNTDFDLIKQTYQKKNYNLSNDYNPENVDVKEYLKCLIDNYGDELLLEEQLKKCCQSLQCRIIRSRDYLIKLKY